jgi:hypothetical protein
MFGMKTLNFFFEKLCFTKLDHSKDSMNLRYLNDLMGIYCKKDVLKIF